MARADAIQVGDMQSDNWHIATVKPGGLHRALFYLALPERRQQVFHPLYIVRDRPTERVAEALFPGYLFVRFDAQREQWISLLSTPGLSGLLRDPAGVPATMPEPVMTELLANPQVHAPGADLPVDLTGVVVSVAFGPFAGHTGRVALSGAERVQVMLSLLGRDVAVQVKRGAVRVLA
jgi:transcription antitermination factor NusG